MLGTFILGLHLFLYQSKPKNNFLISHQAVKWLWNKSAWWLFGRFSCFYQGSFCFSLQASLQAEKVSEWITIILKWRRRWNCQFEESGIVYDVERQTEATSLSPIFFKGKPVTIINNLPMSSAILTIFYPCRLITWQFYTTLVYFRTSKKFWQSNYEF